MGVTEDMVDTIMVMVDMVVAAMEDADIKKPMSMF